MSKLEIDSVLKYRLDEDKLQGFLKKIFRGQHVTIDVCDRRNPAQGAIRVRGADGLGRTMANRTDW